MRRRLLLPLVLIVLAAAGGLLATLVSGSGPELGLDLQGGVSVVLEPTEESDADQLDVAIDVIRTRVDALGVAEPEITRQGDAIVVQLPGVENRDRVLDLVGQTAELRFRPVLTTPVQLGAETEDPEADEDVEDESTTTTGGETTTVPETTTTAPAPDTSEGALGAQRATGLVEGENAGGLLQQQEPDPTTTLPPDPTATTVPPDPTVTTTTVPADEPTGPELTPREEDLPEAQVILADKDDEFAYLLGPTLATGRVVESASAELSQTGQWEVKLVMRSGADGIDTFNAAAATCNPPDPTICPATSAATGSLAIVLDSVVVSAPTISEPSYERDQIVISGGQDGFSESEAKDLALILRYGSLPVELERQTVQTISASLGEDSLRAGVIAGIVGLALVAIYMILYYRALGVVVILGLAVWGSLLFTIISWLGSSRGLALTLAGVTGIIVSVGVTGDSYVVFFERLKDEVRAGRTLRTSTERAFRRAFKTILAADISSFIGASVLWWLTVGSVRGFAFFLGLSTILDVVVAWCFTRPLVTYLARSRVFTEMPFLGVARGLAAPPSASAPVTPAPAGGGGGGGA